MLLINPVDISILNIWDSISLISLIELFFEYKRIILSVKSFKILVLLGISSESKFASFLSLGRLKLIFLLEVF